MYKHHWTAHEQMSYRQWGTQSSVRQHIHPYSEHLTFSITSTWLIGSYSYVRKWHNKTVQSINQSIFFRVASLVHWQWCPSVTLHIGQMHGSSNVGDTSNSPLQWRHNGRDSVSNHQPHDCLLDRLFRSRSKKISKLRVTGLCAGGNSSRTD